jgi:hypothetical protein
MSTDIMLKIDSTIRDSLEFYDKNQELYYEFFKKIKHIKLINNINITDDIIFYDEHKNVLLKSSYEILGVYLPKTKLWKWSWSIPTFHKKYTFISRKTLEYAFNLDTRTELPLRADFLNSKIKIVNNLQLDIHIALSSHLGKQPLIFKYYNKLDKDDTFETQSDSSEESLHDSELLKNNNQNISSTDSHSDNDIFEYSVDDENNNKYMIIYLFILDYKNVKI